MLHQPGKQTAPVGATHDAFDMIFRMRHHAEHIALRIDNAGDVIDRAIWIGACGIPEHDLAVILDRLQRFFVGEIVAIVMGNRAADDLALFVGAAEGGVGIDHFQLDFLADELQRGIAHQRTRKQTGFNQDLEASPPADWTALRERIAAADAVLFVTAEYNRSVPGVLKNAIDVASRPYGQGALAGKPAAIISTSIGAIGGFGANHHLRQSLCFLNMPVLEQPEAYIGGTGSLFDDAGQLTNEGTRDFLTGFGKAFEQHIARNAKR